MEAIETEYEGFRFRSRLEARWAVFFDNMGWDFSYELEGFICPWVMNAPWKSKNTFNYLPDFYLPEQNFFVEVKGSWTEPERVKTLNGAFELSKNGHDVLILGDVFRQPRGCSRRPWVLYERDECLWGEPWPPCTGARLERIADPADDEIAYMAPDLLRGYVDNEPLESKWVDALRAAQKARFEFGETPEVRRKP